MEDTGAGRCWGTGSQKNRELGRRLWGTKRDFTPLWGLSVLHSTLLSLICVSGPRMKEGEKLGWLKLVC